MPFSRELLAGFFGKSLHVEGAAVASESQHGVVRTPGSGVHSVCVGEEGWFGIARRRSAHGIPYLDIEAATGGEQRTAHVADRRSGEGGDGKWLSGNGDTTETEMTTGVYEQTRRTDVTRRTLAGRWTKQPEVENGTRCELATSRCDHRTRAIRQSGGGACETPCMTGMATRNLPALRCLSVCDLGTSMCECAESERYTLGFDRRQKVEKPFICKNMRLPSCMFVTFSYEQREKKAFFG